MLATHPAAAQEHAGHEAMHIGRVRFPTSCAPAAQAPFESGVAYLHSFWFDEAAMSFRAAAAADTTCAMAWWGLASSFLHPLWAAPTPAELRSGADAVARARALNAPTDRERGYIAAIGAFFDSASALPHAQRLRAWERGLAAVQAGSPADTEALIFHALALIATQPKTDTSYAQLRQAGDVLEPLFARQPQHPGIAHYLIHAYDVPALVARAQRAANRYAVIAPDVPHAQHMPSHSYTLLGMWDQSIAANLRSRAAGRRFEIQQHMAGTWDQRLHALDYLVYAYLQKGQVPAARAMVDEAARVTTVVPAGSTVADFALAAIPARYALERGDWAGAAALPPRDAATPTARAIGLFAHSLGAARSGDTAAAAAALAAFPALETAAAAGTDPYAVSMIRINRLAAGAWLTLARGDTTGAIQQATQAAETEEGAIKNPVTPGPLLSARELLGDMLLQVGRPADAAAAYRAALVYTPRRMRSVRGLAAAERAVRHAAMSQAAN